MFGGPFLAWHPAKYAELLAEKIRQHESHVWLINTGWSGGGYGAGERMKLSVTRAIIDAIHGGQLVEANVQADPVFGFGVLQECPHVASEILRPRDTWSDPNAYDETARRLGTLFQENFQKYEDVAGEEVNAAGPQL